MCGGARAGFDECSSLAGMREKAMQPLRCPGTPGGNRVRVPRCPGVPACSLPARGAGLVHVASHAGEQVTEGNDSSK